MLEANNFPPLYTEALSSIAARDYEAGSQQLTAVVEDLTTQLHNTQNADEVWSITSRIRNVKGRQAFAAVEQKLWPHRYAEDSSSIPDDVLPVLSEAEHLLREQIVQPEALPREVGPAAHKEIVVANMTLYGFLGRVGTVQSVIVPAAERRATSVRALADFSKATSLAGTAPDYQALAIQSLYAARLTELANMPDRTKEWLLQSANAVFLLKNERALHEVAVVEAALKIGEVTVGSLFEHP